MNTTNPSKEQVNLNKQIKHSNEEIHHNSSTNGGFETLKTKPTIVVPVFKKVGAFRPLFSSIAFLRHRSKLKPPMGGRSNDEDIFQMRIDPAKPSQQNMKQLLPIQQK